MDEPLNNKERNLALKLLAASHISMMGITLAFTPKKKFIYGDEVEELESHIMKIKGGFLNDPITESNMDLAFDLIDSVIRMKRQVASDTRNILGIELKYPTSIRQKADIGQAIALTFSKNTYGFGDFEDMTANKKSGKEKRELLKSILKENRGAVNVLRSLYHHFSNLDDDISEEGELSGDIFKLSSLQHDLYIMANYKNNSPQTRMVAQNVLNFISNKTDKDGDKFKLSLKDIENTVSDFRIYMKDEKSIGSVHYDEKIKRKHANLSDLVGLYYALKLFDNLKNKIEEISSGRIASHNNSIQK